MAELNGVAASPDQLTALALINYGHFTSFRVEENLLVRGLSLHLNRLATDCRRLFETELDIDRVRHLVRNAVDGPSMVRVTVFDPALDLGHPGVDAQPQVLITTRAAARSVLGPLRLRSACHVRELPEVKHVGLFGTIRHRRLAQRAGFDDVLFVGPDGVISEAATSNMGFVVEGRAVWAEAERLPGVTMRLLSEARAEHRRITLAELPRVEAVFATNAATGVRPVSSIDDLTWSTEHPELTALTEQYARIRGEEL